MCNAQAAAARMLVIYGSETGNTERVVRKMADSWRKRGVVSTVDLYDGNTLAHEVEDLASLATSYDVLIVATSSFGDGDPPSNINAFLLALLTAATEGSMPLKGLQHAVLGEGSSVYNTTFQNCPRLHDKYLEESGSRRFVARHEIDVGGDEDESIGRALFREAVFKQLSMGLEGCDAKPAAAWSEPVQTHGEPVTQIVLKDASELGGGPRPQTLGQKVVPLLVISVVVAAFLFNQFYLEAASE